jgi:hypothetical protein
MSEQANIHNNSEKEGSRAILTDTIPGNAVELHDVGGVRGAVRASQ